MCNHYIKYEQSHITSPSVEFKHLTQSDTLLLFRMFGPVFLQFVYLKWTLVEVNIVSYIIEVSICRHEYYVNQSLSNRVFIDTFNIEFAPVTVVHIIFK